MTRSMMLLLAALAGGPSWAHSQQAQPEVVQPGTISTDQNQTFPTIDPVDGSLWFSVYQRNFGRQIIVRAPWNGTSWQQPQPASFSLEGDRAPRFSPDGAWLYFTSARPVPQGVSLGDMNIWRVRRTAAGWSEPEVLPTPVNSPAGRNIHNVVTRQALYLASNRPGGAGRSDIYRIPLQGDGFGSAQRLGPQINDEYSQPDLYVSPDESWMIVAITDHPDGLGGDDLYFVERDGDGWGRPRNLGAGINSAEYEYGPSVSPDGAWLYFTSHRDGSAHVYRIPLSEIRP